MPGKQKCKMLREIRRSIAQENEIPFATEECRYQGDCEGTCPKCESELRYLEQQLEKRRSLGRKATVAAVALGLTASFAGCSPQVSGKMAYDEPTSEEVFLEGEVAVTEEPETEETAGETGTAAPDDFDPADNVNEDVYGPPPFEEEMLG